MKNFVWAVFALIVFLVSILLYQDKFKDLSISIGSVFKASVGSKTAEKNKETAPPEPVKTKTVNCQSPVVNAGDNATVFINNESKGVCH